MYLTKFGNNLSFNPHLSLVYFFSIFFHPFYDQTRDTSVLFSFFFNIFLMCKYYKTNIIIFCEI
jgi:hypothetical protein